MPNYKSDQTISSYICSKCGASGCKLWRQYNTLASAVELLCVDDALVDQGEAREVLENGRHALYLGITDQIGILVPAVPTEDDSTFWGYTSVPHGATAWWRRLPLRVETSTLSHKTEPK